MCQFRFSLSVSMSVSRDLFLFYFVGLFSKAVFDGNVGFCCFVFWSLWGFLSLWVILWGLVLRSCLMSFSPFSLFLWLLSLLVAFYFYFSILFSLGRRRVPFSLLCATFSFFFFVFHPALCLLVLFSPYWKIREKHSTSDKNWTKTRFKNNYLQFFIIFHRLSVVTLWLDKGDFPKNVCPCQN